MTAVAAPTVMVPIGELVEHPENPRVHVDAALVESIRDSGFYGTVVRQKSTGFVLVGNGRMKAARAAGLTALPVQTLDVDDGHARRILAKDNRLSDLASYDDQALLALLGELQAGPGLEGSFWTEDDLADLVTSTEPAVARESSSGDVAPEEYTEKFTPDAERLNANRRLLVLDLPVDRFVWLVDALREVCDREGAPTNVAAVLLLAGRFTGRPVPGGEDDG